MAEVTKATIMIETELWDRFRKVCKRQDLTASQVIRRFIRDTVENESGSGARRNPKTKR